MSSKIQNFIRGNYFQSPLLIFREAKNNFLADSMLRLFFSIENFDLLPITICLKFVLLLFWGEERVSFLEPNFPNHEKKHEINANLKGMWNLLVLFVLGGISKINLIFVIDKVRVKCSSGWVGSGFLTWWEPCCRETSFSKMIFTLFCCWFVEEEKFKIGM